MNSCHEPDQKFNLHGHRGCRGLMPENSIPAFIHALEMGVQTLELDLAVSADLELVVSHEPYFSGDICLKPDGSEFSTEEGLTLNIHQMSYAEIRQFDCGSKFNPRFPEQELFPVHKPLLSELIDTVEAHCRAHNLDLPHWNLEIKSRPDWDGIYTPGPEKFAELVHRLVHHRNMADRCIIQSFDVRTLQAYQKLEPNFNGALLVDNSLTLKENIERLGFQPPIYSPNYILVTPDLVRQCHEMGMKIYPWTVNEIHAMKKLIAYGVDGLITDYPNRYFDCCKAN